MTVKFRFDRNFNYVFFYFFTIFFLNHEWKKKRFLHEWPFDLCLGAQKHNEMLNLIANFTALITLNSTGAACRDDEGDEGTQATNINELFDFALELLWSLVTKNGWDQTKLPDISEGFSYVSNCKYWNQTQSVRKKPNKVNETVDQIIFVWKNVILKLSDSSWLKRDQKNNNDAVLMYVGN